MLINSSSKFYNLLKVSTAYAFSIATGRPIVWGLPITLSVEPNNNCNLHCPECPSGNGSLSRKKVQMNTQLFSKIMNETHKHLIYLTLYFQGEPFLHPQYIEMLKKAHELGIYTASSTNGQVINALMAENIVRSGLNKLIISIDGTSQETYEKYRVGGSLEKALNAIKGLIHWKSELKSNTPKLELQFLVMRHNEHQIAEIKALSKKLKVKLALKTAQINSLDDKQNLLPQQNKYARYKKNTDGKLIRKKAIRNYCWRAFSGAVIAANGDVLPCAYDKNGEHVFGNINNESLAQIWKNKKATEFRKQLLLNRSQFDICRNCTE